MRGRFAGMLRWPQFDALWQCLRQAPQGWYVGRADQPAPSQPLEPPGFAALLDELEALLKRELTAGYCGVVYADDPEAPGFVKVYDPRGLGSMCSCSSEPTPPAWVLSRCRPARFPPAAGAEGQGRGWWARWRAR